MTVQHHLDSATLLRYASGDLDEGFGVVAATHLALCGDCRRAAHEAEEVGGVLLEQGETAELTSGAFDRLMSELERQKDRISMRSGREPVSDGDVPAPLRRLIGSSLDAVDWKPVAPGILRHAIDLPSGTSTSLYMLKIAPGKSVPEHGHGGSEMTLVLKGAYRDELGRFGPGDIADLDEDIEHQPRVEPGEPCICLVATEAPTRFKGLLSRLLQPLVRI